MHTLRVVAPGKQRRIVAETAVAEYRIRAQLAVDAFRIAAFCDIERRLICRHENPVGPCRVEGDACDGVTAIGLRIAAVHRLVVVTKPVGAIGALARDRDRACLRIEAQDAARLDVREVQILAVSHRPLRERQRGRLHQQFEFPLRHRLAPCSICNSLIERRLRHRIRAPQFLKFSGVAFRIPRGGEFVPVSAVRVRTLRLSLRSGRVFLVTRLCVTSRSCRARPAWPCSRRSTVVS